MDHAGGGVDDGGHPIEPPLLANPAQTAADLFQTDDQMGLIVCFRDPGSELARM
ncbi:MAG: hypothetical protein ACRDWA_02940 [Acidimicrobiia bacterium]